jgi:alpha-beta hydrolase superfamily lysophospholipase
MNRLARLAAAVVLLPGWAASSVTVASVTTVTFHAKDGVPIVGSLYQPSRRPTPCVILVHMLTRSRDDWQALASRLADAGIAALAIDLRGHGSSGADPRTDPNALQDLSPDLLDVQAARAFLASRPDLGVTSVGIAGASIGANLAVLAAASDPTIGSIALLSPGLDYRNLRTEAALKKYGERPVLMIASQEDGYATRSTRRLQKAAGTGVREVRLVNGAGHGTAMLSRQPDLISLIVEWFQRTL